MLSDQLLHILYDWNFWQRPIQSFTGYRLKLLDKLIKAAKHPEIKVLTGVRRAGKTTLMYQVINHLVAQQNPPQSCLYVNFEEPAFLNELTSELLGQIYRVYRERIYPQGNSYLFFDEIQHAYLLFQTLYFAYSLKQSLANNRKIYACDPGLRNAVSYSFTKDFGRLAENLVYLKLRDDYEHVFYWKQTNEVDFVAVRGNQSLPIQVCYSETIAQRELKGLAQFMKEFHATEAFLITEDQYSDESTPEGTIHLMPLWYFLISQTNS